MQSFARVSYLFCGHDATRAKRVPAYGVARLGVFLLYNANTPCIKKYIVADKLLILHAKTKTWPVQGKATGKKFSRS